MPAKTNLEPAVQPNQVWREVDPRFNRWIRVIGIEDGKALLQECSEIGVVRAPGYKPSKATLERFNGKRGGYTFVAAF